jgi:hypothetical protein
MSTNMNYEAMPQLLKLEPRTQMQHQIAALVKQ